MDISKNELDDVYDSSNNNMNNSMTREKYYNIQLDKRKLELLEILLRQTDYTKEEASKLLEESNYNVIEVLNNYHGITPTEMKGSSTTNKQIYGEIRNLMDDGARKFRSDQERSEKYKEYMEQKNKLLEKNKKE